MAGENWLADLLGYWQISVNGGLPFPRRKNLEINGAGVSGSDSGSATILSIADSGGGSSAAALRAAVRVATTANIALSGLITVDGIPLSLDDRVLVKNQSVPADNGIYLAKTTAWVRATDADASGDWPTGTIVPVDQGTTQADALFRLTTNAPVVLGTSALNFARFDTADALSLRGVAISAVAAAANQLYALTSGVWTAVLVANANIAAAAAIAVSKLANGAEGQVIATVAGVPAWASPAASPETVISPPSLAVSQNNYAPAGWSTATVVRLDASVSLVSLSGFDATATVKRKLLINIGTNKLSLPHLAGGQTAGNQVSTPSGNPYVMGPGDAAVVVHDPTSAVWRLVSGLSIGNAWTWDGQHTFNEQTSFQDLVLVYNDLAATGTVLAADFNYSTPVARSELVPLRPMQEGSNPGWAYVNLLGASVGACVTIDSVTSRNLLVMLQLPRSSVLTGAEARVKDSGSNTMTFSLYRQTENFAGGFPTTAPIGSSDTSGGAGADETLTIGAVGEVIDNE